MKKQTKTNAMRLLDKANIPYTPHEYPQTEFMDGVRVATLMGQPPTQVYKTLVAQGASGGIAVFCVPVAAELDLKLAAKAAGEKSVHMVKADQITPLTGYVKGGCSPLGMKKAYPTYIHSDAQTQPTLWVSAGRWGAQIQLSPANLAYTTNAVFAPLCTP